MPGRVALECAHPLRELPLALAKPRLGELAERCASGRPSLARVSIHEREELVRKRDHHLRHASQYTRYYRTVLAHAGFPSPSFPRQGSSQRDRGSNGDEAVVVTDHSRDRVLARSLRARQHREPADLALARSCPRGSFRNQSDQHGPALPTKRRDGGIAPTHAPVQMWAIPPSGEPLL